MKRSLLSFGAVIGGVLALGPLWGKLIAVVYMQQAFHTASQNYLSQGHEFSTAIDQTMVSTGAGFIACVIGLGLLIICLMQLPTSGKIAHASPPPLPPAKLP